MQTLFLPISAILQAVPNPAAPLPMTTESKE
jgi:hypothetical protein